MASFKYTFQKIVDLKGSEKTQAEWLLSDAIALLRREEEELGRLKQQQQDWEAKLANSVLEATPLHDVILINHYIEFYSEAIEVKSTDIQKAAHLVDVKRDELASKMKEEKVWHKAKEHALDRFRYTTLLKEQNELDEMASIRFISPTP